MSERIDKKTKEELLELIENLRSENESLKSRLDQSESYSQSDSYREMLRQIEEKNRILTRAVEQSPVSIVITNTEGNIEFINPFTSKTTGYSSEELLGKNPRVLQSGETGGEEYEELWQTILDGNSWNGIFHNKRKNGELYWESSTIAPVQDENGKITHFVAIKEDITARKTTEEEVKKLSLAVSQSPVGVIVTSPDGEIEFVNPAFEEMSGYSFEDIKGKNTRIFKSGKNDAKVYEDLWKTITGGKVWVKDWINKKKNGEYYWESVSITPLLDEKGKVVNYLAIKQDITARKKTENQIRDLNENLEIKIQQRTREIAEINASLMKEIADRNKAQAALLEKSRELENFFGVSLDLLCISDMEGNFVKVNKSWSDTLGYSQEYIESSNFLGFIHPDDLQPTLDAMGQLSKQNPVFNFTNRYRKADGTYRFIEWRSTPFENRIFAAARDITERKRNEDFELELLDLSGKLTAMTHRDIDTAIDMALARIGNFLDADRAYIFEFQKDTGFMDNTYEWCYEGIEPQIESLKDIPIEVFPHWMGILSKHENVIIPDVSQLPDSWQTVREALEPQGIKSLIAMPMFNENKLSGFVGLDSVRFFRKYSDSEINILNIWGSILTSLINKFHTDMLLDLTRQNFEVFFNTVDDFLWVLDETGNIIYVNNTVIDRLGYTLEELKGQPVLIVHPEERREEAGIIVGKMLQGVAEHCPVPVIAKNGAQIPVETRVKLGYWDGKSAIFGVSKDISKLQLSEQKFSKAFQSGSALMTISDFNTGEYIDANGKFLDTIGYSWDELIGKTSAMLQLFPDDNTRPDLIQTLNEGVSVKDREVQLRTKNGEIRTFMLSADIIHLGERKCLLAVSIDITERITYEEEIKLARNEAEKANIAKSEFLSRMSHELRTPLNSILGFAQLLEMGELSKSQKRGVNHIMHSGKHLLNLINEVLDISRIEAGRLSLSLEPVKLSSIVDEMINIVQPLSENNQIDVICSSCSESDIYVKSDRQSLKQILLNLLNNAIKYNNPGGKVLVSYNRSADSKSIRISVADNGPGIPADFIDRIFTPFERGNAEKTGIEGTGLGLAVVHRLVEALHGQIGVESEFGSGSTFWIELPAAESQMSDFLKNEASSQDENGLCGCKGAVLYIEDNESNIELLEQILSMKRPNISIVADKSGLYAPDQAIKVQPDLILLDLNLPEIHGSEVLKNLKANPQTAGIPIVVISADAMQSQIIQLMSLGAEDYLTKPIEVESLLVVVDKYICK